MSKKTKFWIYRVLAIVFALIVVIKLLFIWGTFVNPGAAKLSPKYFGFGQIWDIVITAPATLLLFKQNKWGIYLAIIYFVIATLAIRAMNLGY